MERKRAMNHKILSQDIEQLVEDGTISVGDVCKIARAKEMMERQLRNANLNKDLDGATTLTFEEYKADRVTKQPVKTGNFTPVQVTIVGRPAETNMTKKHYYIYSKVPNFGKLHQLNKFSDEYNAYFVGDLSNWLNVPPSTQFLVFAYVDHGHLKMKFEKLMALTRGTAEGFTGKCKWFRYSFIPRDDVQVIMLSDKSPYELYGTWNAKLKRRVMSAGMMRRFDQRFEVVRLDSSVEEDRNKALEHVDVVALNEDQFLKKCKSVVDDVYKILKIGRSIRTNVIWIEWVVDKIVKLCRKRESGSDDSAELRLLTVLKDLNDGRLSPTLVNTHRMVYESVFMKKKGRRLEAARRQLVCQETANETKAFSSRRLEDLARYLDKNPTAIYRLHRFYADEPHSIDFSQTDDKERVFRACLEVHSYNSATGEMNEELYRSVVFDKVWMFANPEHGDGENAVGQNVSRKRKRSLSSGTAEDGNNE